VYLYSIFAVVLCVCLCCKDINCCAMQHSISCCGDIYLLCTEYLTARNIHSCACIIISCCGDVYCCEMKFQPSARIFTTGQFCTLDPVLGLFSCQYTVYPAVRISTAVWCIQYIFFKIIYCYVQFCIESFCFGIFSADFVMYCCRISCFEDIYCLCEVYSSSSAWNICCWALCIGYLSVRFLLALQCVTYAPPPPQSPPYKFLHFWRMSMSPFSSFISF
jgi:hypothetical protein